MLLSKSWHMCTLYLYAVAHVSTFSSQTKYMYIAIFTPLSMWIWGRCGGDRMVVGFTTTSAISAYHNWCEFKSRSGWGIHHYVIKFVSNLRQVFSGFSTNKTDLHYITEILLKVVLNNINVVLAGHIYEVNCRQCT
jgi:hypothetical protein